MYRLTEKPILQATDVYHTMYLETLAKHNRVLWLAIQRLVAGLLDCAFYLNFFRRPCRTRPSPSGANKQLTVKCISPAIPVYVYSMHVKSAIVTSLNDDIIVIRSLYRFCIIGARINLVTGFIVTADNAISNTPSGFRRCALSIVT